jgi:hypothetical protein
MHWPGHAKPKNPALSIAREPVSRAFSDKNPHRISHGQSIHSVGNGLEMGFANDADSMVLERGAV